LVARLVAGWVFTEVLVVGGPGGCWGVSRGAGIAPIRLNAVTIASAQGHVAGSRRRRLRAPWVRRASTCSTGNAALWVRPWPCARATT